MERMINVWSMYDQCRVNIWSMYDQCMISAWSMYDMFIDVFQSLLAFCKDLIRHATERCFNGILKCIFRCVVGQEAASPTLGHSRFFFGSAWRHSPCGNLQIRCRPIAIFWELVPSGQSQTCLKGKETTNTVTVAQLQLLRRCDSRYGGWVRLGVYHFWLAPLTPCAFVCSSFAWSFASSRWHLKAIAGQICAYLVFQSFLYQCFCKLIPSP